MPFGQRRRQVRGCSVFLLYWYKSTCFAGTKVAFWAASQTGEGVLSFLALLVQTYVLCRYKAHLLCGLLAVMVLYWYTRTHTDVARAHRGV
jgi:hypothetical protein